MPATSLPPISLRAKPFTFLASARTPPAASSCSTATATPALRSTRHAWLTAMWPWTATSLPPFSPVRFGNLVNNNHPSPHVFCKSIVLQIVKVLCFDRLLQVRILKDLWGSGEREEAGAERRRQREERRALRGSLRSSGQAG